MLEDVVAMLKKTHYSRVDVAISHKKFKNNEFQFILIFKKLKVKLSEKSDFKSIYL